MLIVLEGLDGAGKSTQIQMLRDELARRGVQSEYLHFPRFDTPLYGDLIARFLRGELGALNEVNPYLVALLYAGDRAEAKGLLQGWLSEGKAVILDRYIYSNVAYQCAKVDCENERKSLFEWIIDLEYEHHKIPRPDVSLFLDVPFDFTVRRLSEQREGDDRDYLKGKKDIHEESLELQKRVREAYLKAAEIDSTLEIIDCANEAKEMASPEQIFGRIMEKISKVIE